MLEKTNLICSLYLITIKTWGLCYKNNMFEVKYLGIEKMAKKSNPNGKVLTLEGFLNLIKYE